MKQQDRIAADDLPRRILDNLLEGCQVIGPDLRYVYVNEAAAAHGRTTKAQLLGRKMGDVYPGIEDTRMFAELRQCMEQGAPRRFDNEFTFPDGSKGWFELRFEPTPEGVVILSMDVTERIRAADNVAHLNAVLRGIRNVNQLITRERDPQALIQQTCELLVESQGYESSCIVRCDSDRVLASAVAGASAELPSLQRMVAGSRVPECVREAFARAEVVVRRDPINTCESCPVRRDYEADLDVAAVRLESEGRTFGVLLVSLPRGMASDAEELDLLREVAGDVACALRSIELQRERDDANDQLDAIVRAAPAAIFSFTAEGLVLTWNRGAERIFGWSADETIGRPVPVLSEGMRAEHESLKRRILGGETFSELELERLRKDGTTVWVSVSTAPVRDEEGNAVGVMAVAVDISQRRQVERERALVVAFLRLVNECMSTRELVDQSVRFFREELGFEAAGIRLKEGDDFVDCETTGCPTEFPLRSSTGCLGLLQLDDKRRDRYTPEKLALIEHLAGYLAVALAKTGSDEELAKSRQTLLTIFEGARDGILVAEVVSTHFVVANAAICRMLGYDREELLRLSVRDICPPESLAWIVELFEQQAKGELSLAEDIPVLCKDGRIILADVNATPVVLDGRPCMVGVFRDITSRKRTEQRLAEFSNRLEKLACVVQDLSQARSLEGIVDIVRHAARDLAGSEGATFVLRDGDLCHYVDEDAIEPLWKGRRFPMTGCISGWVMTHRELAVIEDIYADSRIPHDAYRPTFVKSLVMVPIRSQNPVGAIGAYWATTHHANDDEVRILQALADAASVSMENVRVLKELEEGKARTRAIYEHLPSAAFVWRKSNAGFELADFNEAANNATEGGVAALVGKSPGEMPHAPPGLQQDLAFCFERHARVRREVDWVMPGTSASRRVVLTYGFIPSDMVILHSDDVTEQRQTEEQLEAAQRLEAVGRLAGGVAHDFNNLLSVILGYADFAAQELHSSDPIREDIIEIKNAGERAAALTRQLLAFSRKQVLEPEVLDLNGVVLGIESMLRRLLGEDIVISVHLAEKLGTVMADPGQIEQVIMNLAVNARDAMPQGGKLTIETADAELDEAYTERHVAMAPGRYVLLSVTDNGSGMDTETLVHIFDPFFTTKEKGKGTGLGLSTVYGIVKQSGGNVWVYSEVGRGTTFKVYLPRLDAPAGAMARRVSGVVATGTETVLIVEDEVAVCKIAERILRNAGYKVLAATTGGDALLLCERHRGEIDLLLTDVVMPHMSGRELAERLGELQPGLRVLYMSGYTDNAIVHHGVLDAGMRFIGKPFTTAELVRKVREALDVERA